MLNRIVYFSLRFRGVIVALACVVIGYGIFIASHAKLDVFPNFVPPQVVVQTEAPGLSPEQVEVLVTHECLDGAEGLDVVVAISCAIIGPNDFKHSSGVCTSETSRPVPASRHSPLGTSHARGFLTIMAKRA